MVCIRGVSLKVVDQPATYILRPGGSSGRRLVHSIGGAIVGIWTHFA